jgi:hypothetical protein
MSLISLSGTSLFPFAKMSNRVESSHDGAEISCSGRWYAKLNKCLRVVLIALRLPCPGTKIDMPPPEGSGFTDVGFTEATSNEGVRVADCGDEAVNRSRLAMIRSIDTLMLYI